MRKLRTIEMQRLTIEQFRQADKLPLVVVLDNVRSLYNVGSIFRTCDAFRIEALYLCGITATPPHPEVHKTALGAEDSVTWQHFEKTEDAVAQLQQREYRVCAIEQAEGADNLLTMPQQSQPTAVVLGNEVKGVQQHIVDQCDACIEIPQYGTKHSLNVAITAGIVIWEYAKPFFMHA